MKFEQITSYFCESQQKTLGFETEMSLLFGLIYLNLKPDVQP